LYLWPGGAHDVEADATLGELKQLSTDTGGAVWRAVWDLPEVISSLKH
jgi:hypothetical protein